MPQLKLFRSRLPLAATMLLALGLVLVLAGRAQASSGTAFSPGTTTIGSSASTGVTTASVSLAPQDTLSGFQVALDFNPSVAIPLTVSIDPRFSLTLPTCWQSGICPSGTIDLAANVAPGGDACETGICTLFTITWAKVSTGTSYLSPTSLLLTGTETGGLPTALTGVSQSDGSITVQADATNTPPNTPAATNTPTNTPVSTGGSGHVATNTPAATNTPVTPGASATSAATTTAPAQSTSQPSSNTPMPTSTEGTGPGGVASAPTEQVAGEMTPGLATTPVAPQAGTGFSFSSDGNRLTLAGVVLVLLSLALLVPPGLNALQGSSRSALERTLDSYLDQVEDLGRTAGRDERAD